MTKQPNIIKDMKLIKDSPYSNGEFLMILEVAQGRKRTKHVQQVKTVSSVHNWINFYNSMYGSIVSDYRLIDRNNERYITESDLEEMD